MELDSIGVNNTTSHNVRLVAPAEPHEPGEFPMFILGQHIPPSHKPTNSRSQNI